MDNNEWSFYLSVVRAPKNDKKSYSSRSQNFTLFEKKWKEIYCQGLKFHKRKYY